MEHLVYCLFACQAGHELGNNSRQLRFALGAWRVCQDLHHHRDHYPLPALADERDRAVEVEQGEADAAALAAALDVWVDDLDAGTS